VTITPRTWRAGQSPESSITSSTQKRVKKFTDAKTSKREEQPISKSPSFGVSQAICALLNSQIVSTTEEKGSITAVRYTYPPSLLTAFRGLFSAQSGYKFMLHSSSTQASIGGGVFLGYLAWTPSAFSEWSALSALFDECKLLSSHVTWTTAFGPTSTAIICQVSLAPDFITNGSSPSGFTAVDRLAGSTEFAVHTPGAGGASTLRRRAVVPKSRVYASTASPTSSTVDCGCNGQWSFASNIVTTASINIAFVVLRNVIRFRCRA